MDGIDIFIYFFIDHIMKCIQYCFQIKITTKTYHYLLYEISANKKIELFTLSKSKIGTISYFLKLVKSSLVVEVDNFFYKHGKP